MEILIILGKAVLSTHFLKACLQFFFNNLLWVEKKYQAIKSETDPDISLMYGEVE